MTWVGLEPTILAFERAKTVDALDGAATQIGIIASPVRQLSATSPVVLAGPYLK
jgi:hypothetical protein